MTYINSGKLPAALWRSAAAASCLPVSFQGTAVLGAGVGTEPCVVAVQSVPRVREHVVFAIPVPPKTAAPAVQLGQPNSDNYMTSGNVGGVTAVGPPQHREPV